MAKAALESWMYGDPEFHDLRQDLAAHFKVAPENIMVGEGIDGMLGYVSRMFLEPGDLVVTSAGAYPTFNYHVNGYGGKPCWSQLKSKAPNYFMSPIPTTRWEAGGMRKALDL